MSAFGEKILKLGTTTNMALSSSASQFPNNGGDGARPLVNIFGVDRLLHSGGQENAQFCCLYVKQNLERPQRHLLLSSYLFLILAPGGI